MHKIATFLARKLQQQSSEWSPAPGTLFFYSFLQSRKNKAACKKNMKAKHPIQSYNFMLTRHFRGPGWCWRLFNRVLPTAWRRGGGSGKGTWKKKAIKMRLGTKSFSAVLVAKFRRNLRSNNSVPLWRCHYPSYPLQINIHKSGPGGGFPIRVYIQVNKQVWPKYNLSQ